MRKLISFSITSLLLIPFTQTFALELNKSLSQAPNDAPFNAICMGIDQGQLIRWEWELLKKQYFKDPNKTTSYIDKSGNYTYTIGGSEGTNSYDLTCIIGNYAGECGQTSIKYSKLKIGSVDYLGDQVTQPRTYTPANNESVCTGRNLFH